MEKRKTTRLSLNASPAVYAAVMRLAAQLDCTQAAVIRRAIKALDTIVEAQRKGKPSPVVVI